MSLGSHAAIGGELGLPRLARSKSNRRLLTAVGALLVLVLLPVWWWPLVASQDGPSHLYNAAVLNESLAGHGPALTVYDVAWRPVPNWAGPLLLMALLKVLPLAFIPRVMLTITGVACFLATLWLRRQDGRSGGLLWVAAFAGCLATGRGWTMGFESFCLGTAAAIGVIALYERYRDRLDWPKSLAIAGLLTFVFFCHLVPWAFAVGAIAALSLTGSVEGRARRLSWVGAILLAAAPCLLIYRSVSAAEGGGLELDWRHLHGFHPAGVRSWLMLLARADCISLMNGLIPFTGIGPGSGEPSGTLSASRVAWITLERIVLNPFVLMFCAVVLQAVGTAVADVRAKDHRRIGWFVLGLGGVILALFVPDGTPRNGSLIPFRVMLLSLSMLLIYVRFDVGRLLTIGTSLLVAAGFALHTAAIWDYASSANRQLLEVRNASTTIPPGRRIFQMGTHEDTRFLADPVLHSDGYVALWSGGILLSNYEAAHYYFPVKLRPAYPQTLVSHLSELQSLDLQRNADRVLVQDFLADHAQDIDVLLVRTVDERFVSLAQRSFSDVLWHRDDLWVLARNAPR